MRKQPSLLVPFVILAACGGGGGGGSPPPPADARQSILLAFDDGSSYRQSGVQIYVDDVLAGQTDDAGNLRVLLPAGSHRLRAFAPGLGSGQAEFVSGTTISPITITMYGDLDRPAVMSCPQAASGSIPASATELTLVVTSPDAGPRIDISSFTVKVNDARAPGDAIDVTPLFALVGGETGVLAASSAPGFFAAVSSFVNDVLVTVDGVDAVGAEFTASTRFFIGRHTLQIALVPPPSSPALAVANLPITARLIATDVVFDGTSDSLGHVSFAPVPPGTYELTASTQLGGASFTGNTAQFVAGNTSLGLVLLGLPDVLAGVSPTTIYQFADGGPAHVRNGPIPTGEGTIDGGVGSISVTSTAENQVNVNDTSVTFPAGTAKAKLSYTVVSVEYPFYVLSQSVFNDNWTVRVLGSSGQTLFSRVRNVNSQVTVEPTWIVGTSPGTTGTIDEEIDIATLTASGSTTITLAISATNIGDALLPTTVTASLQPADFRIKTIAASPVTPNFSCGIHNKPQTQQREFSLPFSPETNVAQRQLSVDLIGRPEGAPVTRVRVELRAAGGSTALATILDEAPSPTGRVRSIPSSGLDRLEVTVTSSASSPSPLAPTTNRPDQIVYRVTVEATATGSGVLTANKDSPTYGALWRATLGSRTGCRDVGGDDWAAVATLDWLSTNVTLLGAVNDISGEHDRNLGHATHNAGRAVDFRQFTTADFAFDSGLQIFQAVRNATVLAINGNTDAASKVNAWFVANRTGLGALADLSSVSLLYVAASPAVTNPTGVGLPAGWFFQLLDAGEITSGQATLTLAAGAWTNANRTKISPLAGHLDHHHVGLGL